MHQLDLTHTHTHPFNGLFSGTTQVSWYQKGKNNLDFTESRDSEWQRHQLGHMQVCPSCHPTNRVKALKGHQLDLIVSKYAAKTSDSDLKL